MNEDAKILDRICDRYMEEAGEDIRYALRLLAFDFHRLGGVASSGYMRARPVARPRLPKKTAPSIDDPKPSEATPS